MGLGFTPYLLDIGGGFPGSSSSSLDEFVDPINRALDTFFPEGCGVEVIESHCTLKLLVKLLCSK